MKKHSLFLIFILVFSVSCSKPNPSFKKEDISIIPKPLNFKLNEGSFEIKENTAIILDSRNQEKAADFLVSMFEKAADYNLELKNTLAEGAFFFKNVEGLKQGAYTLEVNTTSIVIEASDEGGFFNAVQTIRQLLPVAVESSKKTASDWFVPAVSIEDEPRFSWRGMHMDFSRHFFNIDEVKAFLDYMALYKLNTYHMHLTDDQGWRIEIKKYPLLTEKGAWRTPNNQDTICNTRAIENELYKIDESNFKEMDGERKYGGFFTQEQIKEIISYADERNITVIPEIDMPGHFMSAIDNYPFLLCEGEESGFDTVFTKPACLAEDTTYKFMENILTEVAELFPSKYIHIGGDEVNIRTWKKCPNCQVMIKKHHLEDEHELQSHFNRHIEKFLQSKGKQLMGWDEIVTGGLTEDASVMWWRGWRPEAPGIAADNGNDIVITTTDAYYFDYLNEGNPVEKIYNYEPVPDYFTPKQTERVLGLQANLWSEWIPSFKRLQYQAFPRMLAVSENGWATQEKDFGEFNSRLEKQYSRLDALDVYYYIPAVKGLEKDIAYVDSTKVALELAYPLKDVEIYYSLDGRSPTKEAIKYEAPFMVNDTIEIKARAYRGEKFNDLKKAKVIQKTYKEASGKTPKESGLKRWITRGKFKKVEDIKTPINGNYTKVDSIALGDFKDEKNFSMIYQGYFKAEKDAVYEFETRSDGGNLLYIDDELIVDNGGYHGPRKRYGKVALKKGWHPISIRYKPSQNPRMINVWYGVQGEQLIPIDSQVTGH
ncbi:family 20 glycosylhydrolase [Flagellimonas eckloniae]|uniref:family 20 glycosylhydrolase n=1 Tax=Flagellimonas eckloniae TaxID=346185 RepID=UPI0006DD2762|nr:family 20 glycosylhydrolase [Allomuricauda eckloniae]